MGYSIWSFLSITFTGCYVGFVRNQKKSAWSQRAKEITGAFTLLIANLKVSECFNFREKGYRIIFYSAKKSDNCIFVAGTPLKHSWQSWRLWWSFTTGCEPSRAEPSLQLSKRTNPTRKPRAGCGVVRIDPLRFLAGCRKRRLNQALSVLCLKCKWLAGKTRLRNDL